MAARVLTSAGFKPTNDPIPSDKPAGAVLGSTPNAGVMAAPGTVVKVETSNGKSGMPDVVGKKVEDAQSLLVQKGYTNVKTQVVAPDDGSDFAAGVVWKSDPPKDTTVTKDQQITLFVVPEKPAAPAPSVTKVDPAGGSMAGGTEVTIEGTNLGGVTSVTFGGATGTNLKHDGDKIKVTTPPHAPGPVTVTLVSAGGNVSAPNAFTYTAP